MHIVIKLLIAVLAFVAISKFIAPLLLPVLAPFGIILVVILYIAVVAWLLGYFPVL